MDCMIRLAVRAHGCTCIGIQVAVCAQGAEPLLRAAKARHPDTCQDVGSAALRDLDCEKYND